MIGWTEIDEPMLYYGVRWANKHKSTEDLWTHYFTSSTHVKEFRKKHGDPNLIQIFEHNTKEEAIAVEDKFLIDHVLNGTKEVWLNKRLTGTTSKFGMTGLTHSKESREKISKGLKDKIPWNKGKTGVQVAWNKGMTGYYTHTDEAKAKISKAGMGHSVSKEARGKISKAMSIRVISTETLERMSESAKKSYADRKRKGLILPLPKRITSEETKAKLSKAGMGRVVSKETRAKISKANTGKSRNIGRIVSKETRAKISKSLMGHQVSKESREKMSKSKLKNRNAIKVS